MSPEYDKSKLDEIKNAFPEKFVSLETILDQVNCCDRIFIGSGCGVPEFLVRSLSEYISGHTEKFRTTNFLNVWTLGIVPDMEKELKSQNFRHSAFLINKAMRNAVNDGNADYAPVFLSRVPEIINRKTIEIDIALIQTSYPDEHGYLNLGISVDIVKSVIENSRVVIAQVNGFMPRIHGDGFMHISNIDYIVSHDEELLESMPEVPPEISRNIGKYVSKIVEDNDTIQVGVGGLPNATLAYLVHKKDLGVHTELFCDGIMELMKCNAVSNLRKTIDKGKTIASFCMGSREAYEYVHDNPGIEFRTIDYTNNPLNISALKNMTAINQALEIDLTGQATAESLGSRFYSGIGGLADFMRSAALSTGGKSILVLQSTSDDGESSRIVPFLEAGSGVTLGRGDIHYVVTEYGIAYLLGKNIRERAMSLIAIAHPKFRPWLIEEAKKVGLIFKDQAFIPGKKGEYPESLEMYRTTKSGIKVLLRPVKMSDEPLLKDFFYHLSDQSIYRRFISKRQDMHHDRLQEFVIIDYTKEMVILAVIEQFQKETVVGMAQYAKQELTHTAEVALVTLDDFQNKGIGTELLSYVIHLAKKEGLLGFTAEVLVENKPMLNLFEKNLHIIEKRSCANVYELKMQFAEEAQ